MFRKYDAGNLLLTQAQSEVLSQELDIRHLAATLARLRARRIEAVTLKAPSPFALPLMVERFREQLTTEKLNDRLARMLADMARSRPTPPERRLPTAIGRRCLPRRAGGGLAESPLAAARAGARPPDFHPTGDSR